MIELFNIIKQLWKKDNSFAASATLFILFLGVLIYQNPYSVFSLVIGMVMGLILVFTFTKIFEYIRGKK